jgi:hypothetical protein
VQFVTFQGDQELKTGTERNERKAKRGLMLNFSVTLPRDKPAPPEVNVLLENIKTAPVVLRDFPQVNLSTLRVSKTLENGSKKISLGDPATFTITCLPKAKEAPAGAPAGKDAKPKDNAAVAKAQ